MQRHQILYAIGNERERQLELQEAGKFTYTLSDDDITDFERVTCLVEEIGEVARASLVRAGLATDNVNKSDSALFKELSQIAALCVAWMEALGVEK